MLKTELMNNGTLLRTYSTEGKYILQNETNTRYIGEAIDKVPCAYTYTETEEYVEEDANEQDYVAALQQFGVEL